MEPALLRHRIGSTLTVGAALVLLAALSWDRLPALSRTLQRPNALGTAFGSKDNIRLLTKLESLRLTPPPDESWELPFVDRRGLEDEDSVIRCGSPLYTSRRPSAAKSPSTTLLDWSAIPPDGPVLSIDQSPGDF